MCSGDGRSSATQLPVDSLYLSAQRGPRKGINGVFQEISVRSSKEKQFLGKYIMSVRLNSPLFKR